VVGERTEIAGVHLRIGQGRLTVFDGHEAGAVGVDSQASAAWRGSFHLDAMRPWFVELT
jgi:hypothetical protein